MVTMFAQFSFHLLAPGNVSPDRLKFNRPPLVIEESPVGPLLPADLSVDIYHPMLIRFNRLFDGIRSERGFGIRSIFFRNEVKNASGHECFRFLTKIAGISTINESQAAIGRTAANQFGLILHDGSITSLALGQLVLGLPLTLGNVYPQADKAVDFVVNPNWRYNTFKEM